MPRSCYECRFSEPAYSGNRCDNMIGHKYSEILSERVKNCPLKEVPSGEWYRQANDYVDYYECSNCGMAMGIYDVKNYCPNCGSRNVVEEQTGDQE